MPDMTLNEILRYGLSGALGVFVLFVGFNNTLVWFQSEDGAIAPDLLAAALPFALGALGYAIHRAVIYVPLYFIAARIAGRKDKLSDLDLVRWDNIDKPGNHQTKLNEWAAQIHFLYVSSVMAGAVLTLGGYFGLEKGPLHSACLALSIGIFLFGFVSAIRFQFREKAVFEHDSTLGM